ncbi:hypothetical protein L1887_07190 [Cichorium endivia]|nr:hypothetical protein L1887_07190 [Cichorium endivia]
MSNNSQSFFFITAHSLICPNRSPISMAVMYDGEDGYSKPHKKTNANPLKPEIEIKNSLLRDIDGLEQLSWVVCENESGCREMGGDKIQECILSTRVKGSPPPEVRKPEIDRLI